MTDKNDWMALDDRYTDIHYHLTNELYSRGHPELVTRYFSHCRYAYHFQGSPDYIIITMDRQTNRVLFTDVATPDSLYSIYWSDNLPQRVVIYDASETETGLFGIKGVTNGIRPIRVILSQTPILDEPWDDQLDIKITGLILSLGGFHLPTHSSILWMHHLVRELTLRPSEWRAPRKISNQGVPIMVSRGRGRQYKRMDFQIVSLYQFQRGVRITMVRHHHTVILPHRIKWMVGRMLARNDHQASE